MEKYKCLEQVTFSSSFQQISLDKVPFLFQRVMARWCLFCSLVLCFFILSAARVSDENYRYFAIGAAADSDKEGVVMKSVDGIVWTDVQSTVFKNISSGEADKLYSVAVGDGVWIAFGSKFLLFFFFFFLLFSF